MAAGDSAYIVGLYLGQRRDYTALAVVERVEEAAGAFDWARYETPLDRLYNLRHLERPPLGTPYTEVARRVKDLTTSARLHGRCKLVVDATGVGAPVVDLLRVSRPGCPIIPVTITSGERESQSGSQWRVPKRDLVVGLQVLLEQGRLRIAGGLPEGALLLDELRQMRVKMTPSGHERFEAWRESSHDDLVLAVALACWWGKKHRPVWGMERLL